MKKTKASKIDSRIKNEEKNSGGKRGNSKSGANKKSTAIRSADKGAANAKSKNKKRARARRKKPVVVIGVIRKYEKGFGFIEIREDRERLFKDGDNRDIFVAGKDMKDAMDGDAVSAELLPRHLWRGTRPEARVRKIVTRCTTEVAGTFYEEGSFSFVRPEGPKKRGDIFISARNTNGAEDGDMVVCKILMYPMDGQRAEGEITEIIARKGEPGGDIRTIVRAHGFAEKFPAEVENQANAIRARIPKIKEGERKDLREKMTVTIDGEYSKDFDDAVSVEILPNGSYLLGVHIADVSHYVEEGTPLDREALKRGTSIYPVNQVVPMLPEKLSNNICSLRPNRDRFTLTVDMEITKSGEIVNYDIYESVIKSKERLVYSAVSKIIEGDLVKYEEIHPHLYRTIMNMRDLAALLAKKREERGSINFDLPEAEIEIDETGAAVNVKRAERGIAHNIIEEFMLAANETVAEHFNFMQVPFVYRVHEKPDTAKLEELRRFLYGFGINLKANADSVHPQILAGILKEVKGKPYENAVSTAMLRTMQRAEYDTECLGHFGLSLKYYCHFTSPIRRYPDLIIHRIIKETLHGYPSSERLKELTKKVRIAADMSSVNERKAIEVEREAESLKKTEYMERHVGEIFEGTVSSIKSFGMYVELPNTIRGLVKIESLENDDYSYQEDRQSLIGTHTGDTYSIGRKVTVKVVRADKDTREIDFIIVNTNRLETQRGQTRIIKRKSQ